MVCLGQLLAAGPLGEFVDTNAPRDDGQIRGQTALAPERPEDRIIVGHHSEQDLGDDILNVFRGERDAPQVRGVVNDVVEKAQIAIDEIVPRAHLVVEAEANSVIGLGPGAYVMWKAPSILPFPFWQG